MSRFLSQPSLRHSLKSKSLPSIPFSFNRHRSVKAELVEIDLDSSSSSSKSSDGEDLALKKLEDVIHRIIVQKATPDWLPFIPGSSFWVPPHRRPNSIVDLVSKLANQLTEEETLALTTLRGWPCSSFLFKEAAKVNVEVKKVEEEEEEEVEQVELKVEVLPDSENTSQAEDKKG